MKEFKSFGAFAAHLARLAAVGPLVTHHMVEEGAKEIQVTARGEIGFYQAAAGPYPAWALLAESTENQKASAGYQLEAPLLRTGQMHDSIEVKCVGNEAAVGSNDQVLIYHEFGTLKMPPRPVLGLAAFHSKTRIHARMAESTFAWLSGHRSMLEVGKKK